ncbi:scavenger receptor cysteine-rich type 1 protein M130-like [Indicator indicator]|uniref:scavenger receptor cysteine-rich type 1 protein M130-like n=1 Tax=Indicator indicator TaxID=1002788 RepID=UPI0023DFAD95|nr:scavenger receptor cysteine-rich type 1 protein M130-like [Indicator indicator]
MLIIVNHLAAFDSGSSVSGFVQLVGGVSPCSGRVEINDGNEWKTVCDSDFDLKAASVVCREFQGSPREQPCTQADGAGVSCTQFTGFRLVNGSTACEGRVEVDVQGTWGTLCDSRWDLLDAHVLCRHLNCGFAESIPGGGHFGRGTGPVWRDSFHCDGTEGHLGQCPVTTLGASQCSHEKDAAVICSAGSGSLRLVGGGSRCDGRVEISQRGTWGRVLAEQWDLQEASVVCRQLRCGEAEAAYNPPKPQRGLGPVGLRGVRCAGHEASLQLCNTSLPESLLAAGIVEDVGVTCWGSRQVRLAKGPGRCAGRVEIYYQGSWGSVCDDDWDLPDASVVCHQLGCGGAVKAVGSAHFGEGSGQIWLDGVNCSGAEAALWDCLAEPWGQHDCGHKEDAGVICSEFMALRLENSSDCSGRLQVFYNGTWGSVCSNSMPPKTVSLACKELGCGDRGDLEIHLPSASVSGPAWLDRVECGEGNSSFWQCPSTPWDLQSCDNLRDETHIICNDREKIRAVGGEHRCSGRVEVWLQGSWGTVCDDSWDRQDAEVACRQLGCGPAVSALGEAAFGEGTGPIWLEQVECQGTESSLQDCWARPGDSGVCQHKEDAGVKCSGITTAASVRLVNGPDPCTGRLEVLHNGTWGTVCDDHWDLRGARVVCRQLGCGAALAALGGGRYGRGQDPIWLDNVRCAGTETALSQCPARPWGAHNCGHGEDASVVCSGKGHGEDASTRLVNGSSPCSGRVEVLHEEQWGTVCDDRWGLLDAQVVCREVGCGQALSAPAEATFGQGSGPIWLDEVSCNGTEPALGLCHARAWGSHNCNHGEDAGVECAGRC